MSLARNSSGLFVGSTYGKAGDEGLLDDCLCSEEEVRNSGAEVETKVVDMDAAGDYEEECAAATAVEDTIAGDKIRQTSDKVIVPAK